MRARITLAFVVLAGCGPSVPTFPIYGRDAGLECGDELGDCASGQVCLQRRCYASCSDTRPCGPREECSSGVCVEATERADAGMPDAAPPDPCDAVTCSEPALPFCRAGVCVACENRDTCAALCDVARGICTDPAPVECAPCNIDAHCTGGAIDMTCVTRGAPGPAEQVCLPSCAGDTGCPTGFTCDTTTMICAPTLGSCTGLRAAVTRRTCSAPDTGDAECAPVGATETSGLEVGACFDDTGAGSPPTCHFPCSVDGGFPCPAGLTCNGTFCM